MIIGPQGHPLFDFNHEKLRSLVYEETSFARRRLLHRRVAEAIRAENRQTDVPGVIAGQLAHHYRLAGQEEQAASFYKLAGDHARSLYANAEALEHYDIALALGYAGVAELHEARGDLQVLRGDYGAALRSYEQAAALSGEKQLAGLERKLGEVYHRRGEWPIAELHFELALQASDEETDPGLRSRIYADWSLNFYRQGDQVQAVHLAEKALDLAQTVENARALARAHNLLGLLATNAGEYVAAIAHLRKSLALAEGITDIEAQVAALNNLALIYKEKGDIAQALTATQTALDLCTTVGDRHRQAALHNNLADLLHDAGEEDAAMAQLKQAVRLFAEIGSGRRGDAAGDLEIGSVVGETSLLPQPRFSGPYNCLRPIGHL